MRSRAQRLAAACLLSFLGVGFGLAAPDGLSGYVEVTAARSNLDDPESGVGQRRIDSLLQRYNLAFDRRVFPNLRLLGGFTYDRIDSDQTILESPIRLESSFVRLLPFLAVRWQAGLTTTEIGWVRRADEFNAEGDTLSLTQDTYYLNFMWRPVGLPSLLLQASRRESWDGTRSFLDTTSDLVNVYAEYVPSPPYRIGYRATYNGLQDFKSGATADTWTHEGQFFFSDSWWGGRASLSSEVDLTYYTANVMGGSAGDIGVLVRPLVGLSAISPDLQLTTLTPNPGLIDGDLAASAGVDLGLPPPGGDDDPRQMGVDFGLPTEVNGVYVWIDMDLPVEVAATLRWQVYTSDDNRQWVPHDVQPRVVFGPFENRFEVRFSAVQSRYLKVIAPPLGPGSPFATQYPHILVTELQTLLFREFPGERSQLDETRERISVNGRIGILSSPNLFYDGFFIYQDSSRVEPTWTVSNGFSLFEPVGRATDLSAQFSREDGTERGERRVAYVYSATLGYRPIPAVQTTLSCAGRDEDVAGLRARMNGINAYATVNFYKGLDATANASYAINESGDQGRVRTTAGSFGVAIEPNPIVLLTLNYLGSTERRDEALPGQADMISRRTAAAALNLRPAPALFLYGAYEWFWNTEEPDYQAQRYSFSWTPFPGGSLEILLRFDQSYQSDLGLKSTIIGPFLRWYITRRMYLQIAYDKQDFSSATESRQSDTLSATFRATF